MSPPDINDVLAQAQQMQERMAALQRGLALRTFEGSAGAGMVTATVTGELRVSKIVIEEQLFAGGDREMIQDLTAAAVNAAMATAQRSVQEELQKLSGGLGLPGMGG
jgi:DNA-binding YbaB/EbfC family protein